MVSREITKDTGNQSKHRIGEDMDFKMQVSPWEPQPDHMVNKLQKVHLRKHPGVSPQLLWSHHGPHKILTRSSSSCETKQSTSLHPPLLLAWDQCNHWPALCLGIEISCPQSDVLSALALSNQCGLASQNTPPVGMDPALHCGAFKFLLPCRSFKSLIISCVQTMCLFQCLFNFRDEYWDVFLDFLDQILDFC